MRWFNCPNLRLSGPRCSLTSYRVMMLLALLGSLTLAAAIPVYVSANDSCTTREVPDVGGYLFPSTTVLVDERAYTVSGESRLENFRSSEEYEKSYASLFRSICKPTHLMTDLLPLRLPTTYRRSG